MQGFFFPKKWKGIVICIRESENMEQSKNELIAMLELLFSRTSKREKKQRKWKNPQISSDHFMKQC